MGWAASGRAAKVLCTTILSVRNGLYIAFRTSLLHQTLTMLFRIPYHIHTAPSIWEKVETCEMKS